MSTLRPPAPASVLQSASYRAAHVRGVVVVRWFHLSVPGEFVPLARFINDAAAAARGKIDLVPVSRALRGVPDASHFEEVLEFAKAIRGALDTTHLVVEGEGGFWETIVRSIATRLMVAIDKHGKVQQHSSIDVALVAACARHGLDLRDVRASLDEARVLHFAPEESGRFAKVSSVPPRAARRA